VLERVARVAVDFDIDDLSVALASGGFRLDTPARFVWEGVTST
jgi:O-methyltransferase involved in polyketide biosynthesis